MRASIGKNAVRDPWHLDAPRTASARLARAQLAAGRDLVTGVDELRGLLPQRDRVLGLPLRRRRRRDPLPAHRAVPRHLARRAAAASRPGTRYGFRVDGPWDPAAGTAFNPHKLLLDPYALAPSRRPSRPSRALFGYQHGRPDEAPTSTDSAPYTAAQRGRRPVASTGRATSRRGAGGATRSSTSCTSRASPSCTTGCPRSCAGRTPASAARPSCEYLRDLGVTAVELLPVHQFFSEPALLERGLGNYWGYNTIGFFAPARGYSSSGDRGQQVDRVQADGEVAARRRHRGDPRRRLQPHRRGRRARADALLPRARRPRLLQAGQPTVDPTTGAETFDDTTGTSPAAATPSTPTTRWRCG